MPFSKFLTITFLSFILWTCGGTGTDKTNFSIHTDAEKNTVHYGSSIRLSLKNPKKLDVTSVTYYFNGKEVTESFEVLSKLGEQTVTATVNYGDVSEEITAKIIVLNNEPPKIYSYKIINEYPHDIKSYTQGLEFHNGELYESTGQYGESKLRKVDYKTGEVLKNIDLTNQYFGEGLTILGDKLYQLTWRENTGFIYDVNTFEKTGSFKYGKSKEGWGLCNDGTSLYKSDGTDKIWTLDTNDFTEKDHIQVYTNNGKIPSLNELEWIDGKIFANIYQRNGVVIINPKSGAVEGVIDFSPLKEKVTQHRELDVLNGIAYNPNTKTIFVTGKDWDKLFEVEVYVQD
ncbi:MAG TPA: glutaminyl-peptide cyclotransferase [Aquaticitalea sp.]|nr:glutaminyl-peptide cyclotransferase [Aquaticitalea sp.]